MMRKIKAALLAATVLLFAADGARAEPISVAILTTAGITAATVGATTFAVLTAVTTFALTTAVSYGLSTLSTLLMGRPESLGGVQAEANYGGSVGFSVPFGRCATAGQLYFSNSHGSSNAKLQQIFVLSDWECDGLDGVWVDGKKRDLTPVAIASNEDAHYKVEGFGNHVHLRFYRGRLGQAADLPLVESARPVGRWTEDDTIDGKCYVITHLDYDDDGTFAGIPSFLFELRGAKLYDWRKDSTNGGAGPHRWNDPTTYEWTDNAAVCCYNFQRGLYYNGVRIIGMGVPAADLVLERYTAAANVCDEEIVEGGETRKRYTCSVIVPDEAEWRVAVDSMMMACAGYMIESTGMFGPIAGAAQMPVASLSRADLVAGHPSQFSAKRSRTDKANAIYGTYTNPERAWERDSFPPIEDPAWEAQDGGEKLVRDIALDAVYNVHQANRIARIRANETRYEAEFSGVFPLRCYAYEPGDWLNFDCPEGGNRTYMVAERAGVGQGGVKLSLREIAAGVYTNVPIVVPPIEVIDQPPPDIITVISGFSAAAVSLNGANGQTRPGIRVQWTPPDDVGVREVAISYRVAGNPAVTQLRSQEPESGSFLIQSDIMADTGYEVRARYVRFPDIQTVWSAWGFVTTTSTYVVATSTIATITQNLFDRANNERVGAELSRIREALESWQDRVAVTYQYNRQLQEVVSSTDSSFARVQVVTETLAAADEAFASQLTLVEAKADGASAAGMWKIEAEATPAGALARLLAYARVDIESDFKSAGMAIEVVEESPGVLKGRVVFEADQFAVKTSGIPFTPFAVIGADTYINRVLIGDEVLSANYSETVDGMPQRGFRVGSDGKVKSVKQVATDLTVLGGEYVFGFMQNGIPNDLPDIAFSILDQGDSVGPGTMTVKRTPKYISYQYEQASPAINVSVTSPIAHGEKWAGAALLVNQSPQTSTGNYYLLVDLDGALWKYRRSNTNVGTLTLIYTDIGSGRNMELTFRNPGPPGTIYKYRPIEGLPLHIRSPDTAIGARFWLWGAGGSASDNHAGVTEGGAPGGFVKFEHALKGGEYLTIMPGGIGYAFAPISGFGGVCQFRYTASSLTGNRQVRGGGASIVWRGVPTYANILGVAGGGGAGVGDAIAGGPGGLTTGAFPAGGNPRSTDDWQKMVGAQTMYPYLTDTYSSAARSGVGGGGYVGGMVLADPDMGRGGTSYVIGTATNVTMQAAAADANGKATTTAAPGSAELPWEANVGDSDNNGMIAIEWLYP